MLVLVVIVGIAVGVATLVGGSVHGRLVLAHPGDVRLKDPVSVQFDSGTNVSATRVTLSPNTPVAIDRSGSQVVLRPQAAWRPAQRYSLDLSNVTRALHLSNAGWHGDFQTDLGLEPSNSMSGIGSDFATKPPLQIVIENSEPSRPQLGLQRADVVFEYVSEYSITRMTAMYFNNPPSLIGPVRSCRLINIPLVYAFDGALMCSGVSPGTHARLPAGMPVIINDYDRGNHFMRVGFQFAPHNLFTDAARALRWRAEANVPAPSYTIDPLHPDNGLGTPTGGPDVQLHAVTYTYNQSSRTYTRFDHGTPFIDAGTHAQLQVKTVITMYVPFQVMDYVEDESGGAHSINYQMLGTGAAEIYSDGKIVQATWHMSQTMPIYFTDARGNFIELNSGLTWIHVLGNGQTS